VKLEWRDVRVKRYDPDGGEHHNEMGPPISTSLTAAETDTLALLADGVDVLEIGSAYGYSTVVLAQRARSVVAVDPHGALNSLETLRANLSAYNVSDKVLVWIGRSEVAMSELHASGRRFEMVWIDGDHEAPAVEQDVTWGLKLLKLGGVLACHDYGEDTCPGVKVAIDAMLGGPGDLIDTLSIHRWRAS
jgi:predicted O-methyltransferase YrrM